jgi:hypothetical protein
MLVLNDDLSPTVHNQIRAMVLVGASKKTIAWAIGASDNPRAAALITKHVGIPAMRGGHAQPDAPDSLKSLSSRRHASFLLGHYIRLEAIEDRVDRLLRSYYRYLEEFKQTAASEQLIDFNRFAALVTALRMNLLVWKDCKRCGILSVAYQQTLALNYRCPHCAVHSNDSLPVPPHHA